MNAIVEQIIAQRKTCYFVSPHYDDAVLSAGALISYLSTSTEVVVITVFTKAETKPYTLSAKAYLKQCGYHDAKKLYSARKKENKVVLTAIAGKTFDLGFTEALWRKRNRQVPVFGTFLPELSHLYPTFRWHIAKGKPAKDDSRTIKLMQKKLKHIIGDGVVFCPFGIGKHIDHVIVRIACEGLFPQLIYWSDYPYNQHHSVPSQVKKSFSFTKNLSRKKTLVQGYVSQYKALFKNTHYLPVKEVFFASTYDNTT